MSFLICRIWLRLSPWNSFNRFKVLSALLYSALSRVSSSFRSSSFWSNVLSFRDNAWVCSDVSLIVLSTVRIWLLMSSIIVWCFVISSSMSDFSPISFSFSNVIISWLLAACLRLSVAWISSFSVFTILMSRLFFEIVSSWISTSVLFTSASSSLCIFCFSSSVFFISDSWFSSSFNSDFFSKMPDNFSRLPPIIMPLLEIISPFLVTILTMSLSCE